MPQTRKPNGARYHKWRYFELREKITARLQIIEVYRRLTGTDKIPDGKEYWSLCNEQPNTKVAEIEQLCKTGLINKKQFHGVDWDSDIINANIIAHPEAHWHSGEWDDVIRRMIFNPAIVHYDSTNWAINHALIHNISNTMGLCEAGTLLIINMMFNNPYGNTRFSSECFIDSALKNIPPLELLKWNDTGCHYLYNATGKTTMGMFFLVKKHV